MRTISWTTDTGYQQQPVFPKAVKVLLYSTCIVFFLQYLIDDPAGQGAFTSGFALHSDSLGHLHLWQFVTYIFLHGNFFHLFLNMLGLFFLGPETERAIGTRHFLMLYLLSGVLGGVGWVIMTSASTAICVGASGAVFGVLGAFAALFPHRRLYLLLFPFYPIKAWVVAVVFGCLELVYLVGGARGHIAYAAHLAGGVAGCIYALAVFKPHVLRLPRRWMLPRVRFKVVKGGKLSDAHLGAEMDRILDKISREGMSSLTRREKDVLARMSRKK